MRICSYLDKKGNKFPLIYFRYRLRKLQLRFGIEISYKSEIGAGFHIAHGNGIVIHPNAKIGKNCSILQQVTIGNNLNKSRNDVAKLGDTVFIGAGAKIIGPVNIGNNVIIGANSVVTKDIPSNSTVAGIPARIIS
ncbi:MAG: serine acetyltransferase [Ruminococcus sp.]|nr:serine acetyltransferase [Ruminococcus sp.]